MNLKYIIVSFLLIVFISCEKKSDNGIIKNQQWMTKNLDVDKFQNGTPIKEAKTTEEWITALNNQEPAWCYFDFDPNTGAEFGKIYNWYALTDEQNLAPVGWKLPNNNDVDELIKNLGGELEGGKKIKSKSGWVDEGNGTDDYGLNILPGGFLDQNVEFSNITSLGTFWIYSKEDTNFVVLDWYNDEISVTPCDNTYGFYVRCVKIQ